MESLPFSDRIHTTCVPSSNASGLCFAFVSTVHRVTLVSGLSQDLLNYVSWGIFTFFSVYDSHFIWFRNEVRNRWM